MKINVFATSQRGSAPREELDKISGICAGVCYLKGDIQSLNDEKNEKTQKRLMNILTSGHLSPCDHPQITLEISGIPKFLAMMLNNEKMYTTSEKSARWTRMLSPASEQYVPGKEGDLSPEVLQSVLYDKWLSIFQDKIRIRYQDKFPEFFTDKKITKLAQENARYLTSVFTPTSMVYSASYRQLNNIIAFTRREIKTLKEYDDGFSLRLKDGLNDLLSNLTSLPYYNEFLTRNIKNRSFSLIDRDTRPIIKYFGDVYVTSYKGSFAQLAQAQRHRTLKYSMRFLKDKEFYVPPILKDNENLSKEWLNDCTKLKDNYPQGMMVNITEKGTIEDFILKAKERECTLAQLEICMQTKKTKDEMFDFMAKTAHPKLDYLMGYMKGARCTFPDYTCTSPCHFKEGITEERVI